MRNQTIRHRKNKQNMWYKKLNKPEIDNVSEDIRWSKYILEITY